MKYFIPTFLMACQDPVLGIPNSQVFYDSSSSTPSTGSSQNNVDEVQCAGDCFEVQLSSFEEEVHMEINRHRNEKGLEELLLHQLIVDVARDHSIAMSVGDSEFGHDGFEERTEYLLSQFSYSSYEIAENVGFSGGEDAAQEAVQDWIASEGHRENIEGPYKLSGIGAYEADDRVYFTHIFLTLNP